MDGEVVIQVDLDTKGFEEEIRQTENYLNRLINSYEKASKPSSGFERNEEQLKKMRLEIEKTSNKLIDLRKKQDNLNKGELSKVPESISVIGKSIENVTKKVGKWALAIFGVRSAYMFVRQAVSTLSSENAQIGADIQYIRYAIASTLQPVIEYIIQLVYKLLGLINNVAYAFFGVNLFANATKKALNDSVGSAKELRKQLAGFDEMNVLNDNTSASGGGTGGEVTSPSIDLSQSINQEQAEKIKNFWKGIIDFWENDWEGFFTDVGGNWDIFIQGLGLTLEGFYLTFKGIIETLIGLFDILVGIFTGDFDKIKSGWDTMLKGLVDILKGIIALIVGVLLTVIGTVKGIFLDLMNGIYNIFIKPVANFFVGLWNGIVNGVSSLVNTFKNIFNSIKNIISNVLNGIKTIVSNTINAIWNIVKTPLNWIIDGINLIIGGLNSLSIDIPDWVPFVGGETWGINIPKVPRLAKGTIMNVPGKGVPTPSGNAIWAEHGREAYLPLSDTQLLEELGSTIGKYININATVPVYVGNRQIAREIRKINADEEFAFNR